MRVLMITGDRRFGPGHPRYELQKSAVEELAVAYWGRGAWRVPDARSFDVVTVQDPFWRGAIAKVAARRAGARLNVQVHADLAAESFARRAIASFVLRRADSVRVVSETLRAQVERMGVRAPIKVLPVFIDTSAFASVERKEHEGQVIVWAGRFEREKNPLAAIDILKEVRGTLSQTRLVMLGEGSLREELRTRAAGLPVEMPGWQDPAPYLSEADVALCTSWHESFGASIIEALAAHVPVVAPDVGVAKEAGAVVVPRAELASAVIKVLSERATGELKLRLSNAPEWAQKWRDTL